MRNKRIWLLTMLIVAALFVGCGNKQNDEPNESQKNTEVSSESSEMTEETEQEETPFDSIVKRMREAGLVKENDVRVKMSETAIEVDITYDNSDVYLKLIKEVISW